MSNLMEAECERCGGTGNGIHVPGELAPCEWCSGTGRAVDPDDLPGDYGPAFPEPEPRCHPDDHFRRECWHYQEAN